MATANLNIVEHVLAALQWYLAADTTADQSTAPGSIVRPTQSPAGVWELVARLATVPRAASKPSPAARLEYVKKQWFLHHITRLLLADMETGDSSLQRACLDACAGIVGPPESWKPRRRCRSARLHPKSMVDANQQVYEENREEDIEEECDDDADDRTIDTLFRLRSSDVGGTLDDALHSRLLDRVWSALDEEARRCDRVLLGLFQSAAKVDIAVTTHGTGVPTSTSSQPRSIDELTDRLLGEHETNWLERSTLRLECQLALEVEQVFEVMQELLDRMARWVRQWKQDHCADYHERFADYYALVVEGMALKLRLVRQELFLTTYTRSISTHLDTIRRDLNAELDSLQSLVQSQTDLLASYSIAGPAFMTLVRTFDQLTHEVQEAERDIDLLLHHHPSADTAFTPL